MGTCTCVQEPKTKFVFTKKAREASQEAQLTPDAKGSKKSIDSERITRTSIGQSNLQSDALVPPQGSKMSIDVTPAESNQAQLEESLKWESYFQNIAELTPSVIIRKGISKEEKMKRKKSAQFQHDQMFNLDFLDSHCATPAPLVENKIVEKKQMGLRSCNSYKTMSRLRPEPLVVPFVSLKHQHN